MGRTESLRGVRFSVSHGYMGRCYGVCVGHLEWLVYVFVLEDYLHGARPNEVSTRWVRGESCHSSGCEVM